MEGDQAKAIPSKLLSGFHTRNTLPHLKWEGCVYFVTFRQFGTLPVPFLKNLKEEREVILQQATMAKRPLTWQEQEELFKWYSTRVDTYLDAGHGECLLNRPEIAALVADALRYFDGERYELKAWCIMPNHVHVVLWPMADHTLSDILHSWKSFTATKVNQMLGRVGKTFWQKESYDHLVRDDDDLVRCCEYTTMNPVKARLCEKPEDWRWSSLYRENEGKRSRDAA